MVYEECNIQIPKANRTALKPSMPHLGVGGEVDGTKQNQPLNCHTTHDKEYCCTRYAAKGVPVVMNT